ncbi:ABC transporter substrate-binding protein [Mucisphaera calidilacus]|uniref:Putative arabinose-binding protein n=1 Tax=Mucisphaera calidilacus TaxID=2527982 RepID=A0A518BZV9_9BACT|nr:extracellular solute-binding protein [Mucisphaera calidilacus]QDU72504.1 putative arabinose-binding protein precursor [Mucisphaera calidilacus]
MSQSNLTERLTALISLPRDLLVGLVQSIEHISTGTRVIVVIGLITTIAVWFWPIPQRPGIEFWVFADIHEQMYRPVVEAWNEDRPGASRDEQIHIFMIGADPMVRRALAGFWSDTPVAAMMEIAESYSGLFFSGPLDEIGFVDLTDRLKEEGIYEQINEASFSPWTSRGRIFGLPHDVHPVLLGYRADIVEAAGIDVSTIETWEDFIRVMSPLISDLDGDGITDRYLLDFWYTSTPHIYALCLQAGGGTFDQQERLILDSEANARVAATLVTWCLGEDRIMIDASHTNASGHVIKTRGHVVATLMPDWLAGAYITQFPQFHGKMKIMPLPAWDPGGRRASVMGGTMLAINKASEHKEVCWEFAKEIYLSEACARSLFESVHIISPVKSLWDKPFYRKRFDYFSGQRSGLLYIEHAEEVPLRTSSPFNQMAIDELGIAVSAVYRHAVARGIDDVDALLPVAREQMRLAEERVAHEMRRNVFVTQP